MRMNKAARLGLAGLAALFSLPLASQATMVNWTIDQTNSSITLSIPTQSVNISGSNYTMRVVSQDSSGNSSGTSWTSGNVAHYSGTIATDYTDGSSIEFLTGMSSINAVQSLTGFPSPANFVQDMSLSPGEGSYTGTNGGSALTAYDGYGQIQVFIFTGVGPVAINTVMLDMASSALPISGTNFTAANTMLGIANGSLGVDITSSLVSGALGFSGIQTTFNTPDYANTTASLGSITVTGADTRKLTIPVTFPIQVNSGDFILNGTATGTLVANATLTVPEPGTIVLAAIAAVASCGFVRRRRVSRRSCPESRST